MYLKIRCIRPGKKILFFKLIKAAIGFYMTGRFSSTKRNTKNVFGKKKKS